MKGKILAAGVLCILLLTLCGCTEKEPIVYTYMGTIADFDVEGPQTFNDICFVMIILDNGEKVFFEHHDEVIGQIRMGQQVYENSVDHLPYILINGEYY